MSRPERSGTAEAFYSQKEAAQYESSVRMNAQQRALADRALHRRRLRSLHAQVSSKGKDLCRQHLARVDIVGAG